MNRQPQAEKDNVEVKGIMLLSRDIGIDLGTANTLVYVRGKGVVMREPSVVAVDLRHRRVLAVGTEARNMLGRTPGSIAAVRPLCDGVIADFDMAAALLKYVIRHQIRNRLLHRPRVVVCIPSGVTEVERRAVEDAARSAGAREVALVEEPMAAAIGSGIAVQEAAGRLIVDIGGGTSEVAVISLGDIVTKTSIRIAGDDFDEAIVRYVKRAYNLLIGRRTAEEIKIQMGSAYPLDSEIAMPVKGRNLVDGLPGRALLTSEEVRTALREPVHEIVGAIRRTLENTPPELAADIIGSGITLTGGGALLQGLDLLIAEETGIPVTVAEDPLDCVANGTGYCLEAGRVGQFLARG